MKVEQDMCFSQLLTMMMLPDKFYRCVKSYTATSPNMDGEGFNGFMQTKVTFEVTNLKMFAELVDMCYTTPSDRSVFYHLVRDGKFFEYAEQWRKK